jgi:hypothetical protein
MTATNKRYSYPIVAAIRIDVHPTVENPINMIPGNLSRVIDRVKQCHCSREKGLPTQSTARRLTDTWVRTQFLSWVNLKAVGAKPSICRWQATRFIGSISPACDRYVQYLLTGTNPSILNRHRRGLPHRNLRIATSLSMPFPSECSTDPPKWPHLISGYPTTHYQLNWREIKP